MKSFRLQPSTEDGYGFNIVDTASEKVVAVTIEGADAVELLQHLNWDPADLVRAARDVVARWEHGDLAEAVQRLDAAVKEYDQCASADEGDRDAD